MEIINAYFKSLVFTRIEEKQGYAIYGAGVNSGISGGIGRYVLVFVPSHLAVLSRAKITDLAWTNIQTRELRDSYRLKKQVLKLSHTLPNIELHIISRDKKSSTYIADGFPFEIVLLHNPKKKSAYQYNNKMMLSSVLDTYQCVITYTGNSFEELNTNDMNLYQQNSNFDGYGDVYDVNGIDDSFDFL